MPAQTRRLRFKCGEQSGRPIRHDGGFPGDLSRRRVARVVSPGCAGRFLSGGEGLLHLRRPAGRWRKSRRSRRPCRRSSLRRRRQTWTNLTRHSRLAYRGGQFHLLGLGDSIANDTMRSGRDLRNFRRLFRRRGSERRLTSVAGEAAGGITARRDESTKTCYRFKPDLVFIGGISQGKDPEPTSRCHRPDPARFARVRVCPGDGSSELLPPRTPVAMAKAQHSGDIGLRSDASSNRRRTEVRLPRSDHAVDGGDRFGVHPHRFYRDRVHANEYGEQIISEILIDRWTAR